MATTEPNAEAVIMDGPSRPPGPTATAATTTTTANSLPQKRILEDDHAPAISSPLNPSSGSKNQSQAQVQSQPQSQSQSHLQNQDDATAGTLGREKRTKKESLKKRESNVRMATPTPEPKGKEKDKSGSNNNNNNNNNNNSKDDSNKGRGDGRNKSGNDNNSIPSADASPMRYKLAPPKLTDFEPARGPVFVHHHDVTTISASPAVGTGAGAGAGAGEAQEQQQQNKISFYETTEHVRSRKNYHYVHCIADPAFPSSFYYRQTESQPYGAHISFEDTATHMFMDQSARHITTNKGYRMARANVAVRQGRWYWECKITQGFVQRNEAGRLESHGHIRLGFARREASLDAPVGFDAYSYGIRDVEGQQIHMSRPKDFFPPGQDMKEGDVIGLEIHLPSENLHRKVVTGHFNPAVDLLNGDAPSLENLEAPNIVRDRIPIRFKQHIYLEKIDYHSTKDLDDLMNPSPTGASGAARRSSSEKPNPNHPLPALRTLPRSSIRVYKNGVLMGTPFTDLLAFLPPASKPQTQVGAREGMDDGMLGYYPAVSVFRGGAVEVNFGPKFWCPPPDYTPQSEDKGGDVDGDVAMDRDADADAAQDTSATMGPLHCLADRYEEQIAEDVVADIIDEVGFWMQDGARVVDRLGAARDDGKADVVGAGVPGGREEIKELVQDD